MIGAAHHASTLTVTLFGENDVLDRALSQELGQRGCRTHSVTVETGWLRSATHAILRLDTKPGARALEELATVDSPRVHVVATCERTDDDHASELLRDLCRQCGDHHDISLIWHTQVPSIVEVHSHDPADLPAHRLAAAIIDEVSDQTSGAEDPSFSSRSVSFR